VKKLVIAAMAALITTGVWASGYSQKYIDQIAMRTVAAIWLMTECSSEYYDPAHERYLGLLKVQGGLPQAAVDRVRMYEQHLRGMDRRVSCIKMQKAFKTSVWPK
jgi:hypothetical protein